MFEGNIHVYNKCKVSVLFVFFVINFSIKGSVTLKKNEVNKESSRKARVKCEMVAALEACRLLHKQGELNDELKPVFRYACTYAFYIMM